MRWAVGADFRRIFRELITTHNVDIAILTETRVSRDRENHIIVAFGFECYLKVDEMGFARRILIL